MFSFLNFLNEENICTCVKHNDTCIFLLHLVCFYIFQEGQSPLHLAVMGKHEAVCRHLLKEGSAVDITDRNNRFFDFKLFAFFGYILTHTSVLNLSQNALLESNIVLC